MIFVFSQNGSYSKKFVFPGSCFLPINYVIVIVCSQMRILSLLKSSQAPSFEVVIRMFCKRIVWFKQKSNLSLYSLYYAEAILFSLISQVQSIC